MKNPVPSPTKATIIIAAYNEAAVIRNTLKSLSNPDSLDSYQILVICNGCTDNTEDIVRDEFQDVYCHSLTQASKAMAIRYAESLAPGFPRLYLDADIEMHSGEASALISMAAKQDSAMLFIPKSQIITDGCQALVKSFYRAWYATPHVTDSGYGAGAYLINQSARKRFDLWPDLIADDAFVRSQFCSDEIHIVAPHHVEVKAPKTVWTLMKVKARSKFGNLELRHYLKQNKPTLPVCKTHKPPSKKAPPSLRPEWYDRITYVLVNSIALSIAKWQFMIGAKTWHRDNSNR